VFASILAAALLGAVGGGLGGLLGSFLEKVIRNPKSVAAGKRSYGALVGAIVGMTVANAPHFRQSVAQVISPPSAVEKFGQDLLAIPQVQERIRGKSPREVQSITQSLSAAGMLKLDDGILVTRVHLVDDMLSRADGRFCAAFAKSTLNGDDFMRMMTDEQKGQWFRIVRAAVEAEVGVRPSSAPPPPTADQIAQALSELQAAMPASDRSRFASNIGALVSLSPTEACWTVRTLYSLVDKASRPKQAVLARALMMN
jgi:hypothetical protein